MQNFKNLQTYAVRATDLGCKIERKREIVRQPEIKGKGFLEREEEIVRKAVIDF